MKAYAFLANDSEEVECLMVVDILKRAGIEVDLVSIYDDLEVKTAHDINIRCDKSIKDINIDDADLIFIPGGLPGANYMRENEELINILKKQNERGKHIGAICAAPYILGDIGLVDDKKATVYPGFEKHIPNYTKDGVYTDGNITTARGLGFSIDMGLELLRVLVSEEKSNEIREKIQYEN